MSVVTLLAPDVDRRVGRDTLAVQQMMSIAKQWDETGTLPSTYEKITPDVIGHGEAWIHPLSGLFIVRADHRPILLANEKCVTCGTRHVDIARAYIFESPDDFDNRIHERYTRAPLQIALPSTKGEGA